MVNATIDNDPVSIQLETLEETTVPANETWKVTIAIGGTTTQSGAGVFLRINTVDILTCNIGFVDNNYNSFQSETISDVVLKGGDVIKLSDRRTNTNGGLISGFVVDS